MTQSVPQTLALNGVHHTARPTWKLKETVEFYRDVMGLPLIHCIAARGWGPNDHPDFLHFFFDSGNDSTIAFFYYIGTDRPEELEQKEHHFHRATHTAWLVPDMETLAAWKDEQSLHDPRVSLSRVRIRGKMGGRGSGCCSVLSVLW